MRPLRVCVCVSGASLLLSIGLAALSTIGCGSDSGGSGGGTGGSSGKSKDGSGGGKSQPDAGASTGAASSAGGAGAGGSTNSVPCGSTNCTAPEGSTPCCKDQFKGSCGVKATGFMMGCVDPPKPPPVGCPMLPAYMGFQSQPCCTSMGQCGVSIPLGGNGCVDITTAAAMAMAMGINVGQVPAAASCTPADGGT